MNYGGDCRTAPATPGLLIIVLVQKLGQLKVLYLKLVDFLELHQEGLATNETTPNSLLTIRINYIMMQQ